jgi:hypothetical protein
LLPCVHAEGSKADRGPRCSCFVGARGCMACERGAPYYSGFMVNVLSW